MGEEVAEASFAPRMTDTPGALPVAGTRVKGSSGDECGAEAEEEQEEEGEQEQEGGGCMEAELECEVCGHDGAGDRMLLCDGCNRGWHTFCLVPALAAVPRGRWLCPLCLAASEESPACCSARLAVSSSKALAAAVETDEDVPLARLKKKYLVRKTDTQASKESESPKASRAGCDGSARLGKQEASAETSVDVGVEEGGVGSVDDTQAQVAGSGRSSQRAASQQAERGIVDMRRMVHGLVRRIHYSAFSCPSKDTWVDYHRTVDRSLTACEVAERLVWAARQLLPGMLRAAWLSRKEQWEARCLACRDKNALRLLKFELEKYAISWEAVEASATQQQLSLSALSAAVKNEGKEKVSTCGQKRSQLKADVPVKRKRSKAEKGGGTKGRLELAAGKGREERYKRGGWGCHASDVVGDGGSGAGAGQEESDILKVSTEHHLHQQHQQHQPWQRKPLGRLAPRQPRPCKRLPSAAARGKRRRGGAGGRQMSGAQSSFEVCVCVCVCMCVRLEVFLHAAILSS